MGKKVFLWVLTGASFSIALGALCDQYEVLLDPFAGLAVTFVALMVVTRLIFDGEYQQASVKDTIFYYVVNAIVSATFLFSMVYILGSLVPEWATIERARDPQNYLFESYQQRLADARDEIVELNGRLTELQGEAVRDDIVEVGPLDLLTVSDREQTLREELAMKNGETVAATALVIDDEDGDFVRGRVAFATGLKKNGIFFGHFSRSSNQWEIFHNEVNDGLRCDGYKGSEIEIPKSMLEGCEDYAVDGDMRAADGWKLVGGDPQQNCSKAVYSGEVEVRAWLEWRTNYVEKDWVLAVADEDRPKLLLGWPWKPYFSVPDISDDLRVKLMAASSDNPLTVTVKKMSYYCEGQPWLDIE